MGRIFNRNVLTATHQKWYNPLYSFNQRGLIMNGRIDSRKRCQCGGTFKHDENQKGLYCRRCNAKSEGPFRVRYGKKITRNFGNDYKAAEMFLLHLRHQTNTQAFDHRDYMIKSPLGFVQLVDQFLEKKKHELKSTTYNSYLPYFKRAAALWGNRNIKDIRERDIENFLDSNSPGARRQRNRHRRASSRWSR